MKIEISQKNFNKLNSRMRGFESHDALISFLINYYEYDQGIDSIIEPSTSLEIRFEPENNVEAFKTRLLLEKKAWLHLEKTNNTTEIKEWKAAKITKDSDIIQNLRSGPLRNWKKKGITQATVNFTKTPF